MGYLLIIQPTIMQVLNVFGSDRKHRDQCSVGSVTLFDRSKITLNNPSMRKLSLLSSLRTHLITI